MTSTAIRAADLAGTWYPDTDTECRRRFAQFDREAVDSTRPRLFAGIVPHAGWTFSGAVAYNTIRELAVRAAKPDTVVLFAGHMRPSSPMTVMSSGACWTPLGDLVTDEDLAQALCAQLDIRAESPTAHSQDNSAETQFPLIKHFFPGARLLIIGAPPRDDVIALVDALADIAQDSGRCVVALGSTDLTHYGPNYMFTPHGVGPDAETWVREVNDPMFIQAARSASPQDVISTGLQHHNACCPGSVAAAKHWAQRMGTTDGEQLRYCTSADIHRNLSFVGYCSVVY